jgi:hypothetical protein
MSDDPERTKAAALRDLRTLAEKLLEQSRQLGDAEAVEAAEKLHEHAHADPPSSRTLTAYLRTLETRVALSPTVIAFFEALANVGM